MLSATRWSFIPYRDQCQAGSNRFNGMSVIFCMLMLTARKCVEGVRDRLGSDTLESPSLDFGGLVLRREKTESGGGVGNGKEM